MRTASEHSTLAVRGGTVMEYRNPGREAFEGCKEGAQKRCIRVCAGSEDRILSPSGFSDSFSKTRSGRVRLGRDRFEPCIRCEAQTSRSPGLVLYHSYHYFSWYFSWEAIIKSYKGNLTLISPIRFYLLFPTLFPIFPLLYPFFLASSPS